MMLMCSAEDKDVFAEINRRVSMKKTTVFNQENGEL